MVATKLKITRLQEEETTNGFYNHGILERGKKSFDRICKTFLCVSKWEFPNFKMIDSHQVLELSKYLHFKNSNDSIRNFSEFLHLSRKY